MVRAIVTGAAGRMGGRIISLIAQTDGIELAGAVEMKGHPLVGSDAGERLGLGRTGVLIEDDLAGAIGRGDVVIDFTFHEASIKHLETAASMGKAIVIGSTGVTDEEMKGSGNSLGASAASFREHERRRELLFNVLPMWRNARRRLRRGDPGGAPPSKKDAPSGTAIAWPGHCERLGRDLGRWACTAARAWSAREEGRDRNPDDQGRGYRGGAYVIFGGIGSGGDHPQGAQRDNFAGGAIRAALWLVGQPTEFTTCGRLGLKKADAVPRWDSGGGGRGNPRGHRLRGDRRQPGRPCRRLPRCPEEDGGDSWNPVAARLPLLSDQAGRAAGPAGLYQCRGRDPDGPVAAEASGGAQGDRTGHGPGRWPEMGTQGH